MGMPKVIIPGGGVLHTWTVRTALDLGLTPVVTDINPECPCASIEGVQFIEMNCYAWEEHAELSGQDVVGAFCAGADTHVSVAAVMERIGNPNWVSVETALSCKVKPRAKLALLRHGVPTAGFATGYPAIRKPLSSCGSRGVEIVYEGSSPEPGYYCEEILYGPEQSVEVLLGPRAPINVVDRHFNWTDGRPQEWGHTNPSRLSFIEKAKLYDLTFAAAEAVGAEVGFFKCDTIWTLDGPKVLECTPRLSGGFDSQVSTPLSTGRNLIRYGIRLACGMDLDDRDLGAGDYGRVLVIHRPDLACQGSPRPLILR